MLPSPWQRAPSNFGIGSGGNFASKNKSIVRGLAYHRRMYKILHAWAAKNPDLYLDFVEEPWLTRLDKGKKRYCQPDGVLLDRFTNSAIAVEVKMNWKDGRDETLIKTYLQAVKEAYGVDCVWPLLITGNVSGYKGEPLLGLKQYERVLAWKPGDVTPVMLIP